MAKTPAKASTEPARPTAPRSGKGGSYVRQPDGTLRPNPPPPAAAEPQEGN